MNMKKNTFYFSHDYTAKTDPKILRLRMHFGMEGYGIYWYLIECLAENGGRLPLEIVPMLSKQMCVEDVKVQAVIFKYDLFIIDNDEFFSLRLCEHLDERKMFSESGKRGNLKRWGSLSPPESPPESQERKGKEIKGKESKEYERDEVVSICQMIGLTENEANAMFDHYNSQGWIRGNGQAVTNIHSLAARWKINQQSNSKKEKSNESIADYTERAKRAVGLA